MHHVRPRCPAEGWLWLIAGTGEGPLLTEALLARGWNLRVAVVSHNAALAYRPNPRLRLDVGAIEGEDAIAGELARARRAQVPYSQVIDASHPFAERISASLAAACRRSGQDLLRLERHMLPVGKATLLARLEDLIHHCGPEERLLLAIGARQLALAVRHSPAAVHHCRILPRPEALRLALAAGLPPHRVAPLHPTASPRIARALCLRWGITSVLCRQSGGPTEAHWHDLAGELSLRLLLLKRPEEPPGVPRLPLEAMINRIGSPKGSSP